MSGTPIVGICPVPRILLAVARGVRAALRAHRLLHAGRARAEKNGACGATPATAAAAAAAATARRADNLPCV